MPKILLQNRKINPQAWPGSNSLLLIFRIAALDWYGLVLTSLEEKVQKVLAVESTSIE